MFCLFLNKSWRAVTLSLFRFRMLSVEQGLDLKKGDGKRKEDYVERISLGRFFVNVYIWDGNSVSLELASIFVHVLGR